MHILEAELKELEIRVEELKLLRKEYSDRRNVQLQLPHSPLIRRAENGEDGQLVQKKHSTFAFEDIFDFRSVHLSMRRFEI